MFYYAFENQFSVAVLRHLLLYRPVWFLPPAQRAFRMRHQTENCSFGIADACDVVERAVGVRRVSAFCIVAILVAVTENHHVILIEPLKQLVFFFFREQESPLSMRYGHAQHFVLWDFACENAFSFV